MCARPDCDTTVDSPRNEGFCFRHYKMWERNGVPYLREEVEGPERPPSVCARPDCETPLAVHAQYKSSEYCYKHRRLIERNGVPYRKDEMLGPEVGCATGNCPDPIFCKGMCRKHYMKSLRASKRARGESWSKAPADIDSALDRLKEHAANLGVPGVETWEIEKVETTWRIFLTHPTHRDEHGNPKRFLMNLGRNHQESLAALHLAEMFLMMNPAWTDFAETFDPQRTKAARERELAVDSPYILGNEIMEAV